MVGMPGSFALHIARLSIFAKAARRVRISLLRAVNPGMPAALRRPIFYFDSVGLVKNAEKNGEACHPMGLADSALYGKHDCFLARRLTILSAQIIPAPQKNKTTNAVCIGLSKVKEVSQEALRYDVPTIRPLQQASVLDNFCGG